MIGPCSCLINLGVRFTKISVQWCFSSLFWLSRELSIEGCCDHLVNFGLIVFWVGVFRWCRCEILVFSVMGMCWLWVILGVLVTSAEWADLGLLCSWFKIVVECLMV